MTQQKCGIWKGDWAVILNSKGKGTLFSVWWWFCFSLPITKYAFWTRIFALIHPVIIISKEMLVTPPLENSVFQSCGLCYLPLPSPYLHTDISDATEMHFPHCCFLGLWLHALLSPSAAPPLSVSLKLGRHLTQC